jgi:hypothetical protein
MWKPLTMRRRVFRFVFLTAVVLLLAHAISNVPNDSSPNADIIKFVVMGGLAVVYFWQLNVWKKQADEERAYQDRMERARWQIQEPLIWEKMSEEDREAFTRQYSANYIFGTGTLMNWRRGTVNKWGQST